MNGPGQTTPLSSAEFAPPTAITACKPRPMSGAHACPPTNSADQPLHTSTAGPPASKPLASQSMVDITSQTQQVDVQGDYINQFSCRNGKSSPISSSDYLNLMASIHNKVRETNVPNYQKARISLPRKLDVTRWRALANDYNDPIVFDYLEFGFPVGYVNGVSQLPSSESSNHPSALKYPDVIQKHIDKEIAHGAMLGPFKSPPYVPWCHVSPLMTADKKDWSLDDDTEPEKRVVTDLSWPHGLSVNDGCPRDVYDSYEYKLQLPSADNLINLILKNGPGCWLWSSDYSRAFRQLPLDPLDWPLLCIKHNDQYYSDVSLAFGARWASSCCQRMSNTLVHILAKQDYDSVCYIDDSAGCEKEKQTCESAYDFFNYTCDEINLDRAVHKGVRSTQLLKWIGWLFDTVKMQVSLPEDKKRSVLNLCKKWCNKTHATLRELRQLLGKLLHISQVVKPARLFLNRMLDSLRSFPAQGHIELSQDFMKDVHWFVSFLDAYNGISMIVPTPTVPHVISVDSCLTGCGAVFKDQCYHHEYSERIANVGLSICHLEMLNCLLALRMWCTDLYGETVVLNSDSQVAINVLQNGRSRDEFMLHCARNVWMILALHQITLISEHVPGESLTMSADALSRCHLGGEFKERAIDLINRNRLTVMDITPDMFNLDYSV